MLPVVKFGAVKSWTNKSALATVTVAVAKETAVVRWSVDTAAENGSKSAWFPGEIAAARYGKC